MLELKIANKDITNGNLAVAWCVDQQLLKDLSDSDIKDPQVVIVVAPTKNYSIQKEYRKVVALKDLMTYIEFRVPGENKIWAFIPDRFHTKKDARNQYLTKDGGVYHTSVLGFYGEAWSSNFNYSDGKYQPRFSAEVISVDVPDGIFAPEPAAWEKAWVNHWFRSKPIDQCDFRRRRLLAYTVKPVVMVFDLLIRTLFLLVSTLWLSRGMSFKYLMHPLSHSFPDSFKVLNGGTYTVPDLPDELYADEVTVSTFIKIVLKSIYRIPLMPVVFVPILVLWHFHKLWIFLTALTIIGVVIGLVMFFASGILLAVWKSVSKWMEGDPNRIPWYLDQDEIDVLTCSPDIEKRTSVHALPVRHRTIHLRFQDLKARICRPFSA